jgi:hypothetical protein
LCDQIWFQFKLVWNLENIFEKDKVFSIFPSLLAETGSAQLASPPVRGLIGPTRVAKPNPTR